MKINSILLLLLLFLWRKHRTLLGNYNDLTANSHCLGTLPAGEGPSTSKQLKLEDIKASQKSTDLAVLNFVVQGLHPFVVVEQPGLFALMQHILPNYRGMSRTTLRDRMENNTKQMKAKVTNAMENIKYIATTTDGWKAHRSHCPLDRA